MLELAKVPDGFGYVFELHREITERRRFDPERGEMPLDWHDFAAWKSVTGRNPTAWDIRMICRIDDGYFGAKLTDPGKFFGS